MGDIVLTPFCEYSFYAYHYFTDEEKRSVDCFFDNDKLVFAKINEAGNFNILIRKIGVDK